MMIITELTNSVDVITAKLYPSGTDGTSIN